MRDVDVVIATRNRPQPLERCLTALTRQAYRDFGVIVVDDASDEPVADHLPRDLRDALTPTVLRQERRAGPGAARNAGVAESGARYIVFVDDDVCAQPELVARHVAALAAGDGERRAAIGPLAMPPDWRPTPWNLWEARTVDVEYGRMLRGEYRPTWRQFHTGNASLVRADFEAVGGFDERFDRAEDIELALRLRQHGVEFVFDPLAIGWHYAHRSLAAWRNVARSYARTDVMLSELHPELGWLHAIGRERARRHPALLLARRAFERRALRPLVTAGATGAARVLHAARARRLAMYGLSLAYDLEYSDALRHEVRAACPVAGGTPWGAASRRDAPHRRRQADA